MIKEELFSLIKSMNKNEKRYFKMYASMMEKKEAGILQKLFIAIDAREEYDEKKIKHKFRNEGFVRHFTATKYYLQKLIIKSLSAYHNNSSEEIKLNSALTSIEILFKRGLFDIALKMIEKSKHAAKQKERYTYYLELLNWEKRNLNRKQFEGVEEKYVENVRSDEKETLDKLKNIRDYQNIHAEWWYHSFKKGFTRSQEEAKPFNSVKANPLVKSDRFILTKKSWISYYMIHSVISREEGDIPKSSWYRNKLLDYYQQNPGLGEQEPELFINAIASQAFGCISSKKYREAINIAEHMLTALDPKSYKNFEIVRTMVFENSILIKLLSYSSLGEYKNVIALVPEFETGSKELERTMNKVRYLTIVYGFSYAYLAIGDHKNALKWLNKILNTPAPKIKIDIISFARIMNLIIYYEMQDEELLEHIVKSTYRFLYKQQRLYKIESLILNFLRRSSGFNTNEKMILAFKKLRSEMIPLQKDLYEARAFNYFDFISWVESKIEKRPFAEIVKEKVKDQL